jgi:uncharacterized cupin superfamily protein
MLPALLNHAAPELQPWGTPEDIGAETLEGPIAVAGLLVLGTLETAISAGYYSATRGRYRVVYPFHEHATVLEGRVTITESSTGRSVTYGPGDSWVITKGEELIWSIETDIVRKFYFATTGDI